jgi:hypothetical protein
MHGKATYQQKGIERLDVLKALVTRENKNLFPLPTI